MRSPHSRAPRLTKSSPHSQALCARRERARDQSFRPNRPHSCSASSPRSGASRCSPRAPSPRCCSPPYLRRPTLRQCLQIGYLSLPVIGLTAVFIGAALALNIYVGGARFNAESFVPNIVVLGITRELGPVLAGLMLAGRVSAGIAAEIGTMRVTEQIDAMTTLSTDPFKFLIAPRVLAADADAAGARAGRRHYRRHGRLSRRGEQPRLQRRRPICATRSTSWRPRTLCSASPKPPCSASSSP
jgi:hypothetical protein